MASQASRVWMTQFLASSRLLGPKKALAHASAAYQRVVGELSATSKEAVRLLGVLSQKQRLNATSSNSAIIPLTSNHSRKRTTSSLAHRHGSSISRPARATLQHTTAKLRTQAHHRSLHTSRPLLSQPDISEHELAHIAAQRQVEATGSAELLRPMMFTIGVTAVAWLSAEYWRVNKYFIYKEWRQYKRELYEKLGIPDPSSAPKPRIKPVERGLMATISRTTMWDNLTPAQRLMMPMIALCSGIFGLWMFPVFGLRWMYKNFAHIPNSGISRTLLTSAFSHATILHLAFNMLALWSFSEAAYPLLGPEYYLATVASGAVVASMAQHVYGMTMRSNPPALGASGFVFSIVTYVALSYPNNQALLLFVIPAPLITLLQGMVVFDLIGLTGVWGQLFNFRLAHAAHLGGVALGSAVWWLNQRENRRKLARAMPDEAVGLYNKSYDALIKRSR